MPRLTKQAQADQAESLAHLRAILPPGSEVCTVLRHVSRSGMYRRISLIVATLDDKGQPRTTDITWHAARAMGESVKGRGGYVQDVGLGVGGCGMDMGYHLVMNLSYTLHGTKSKGRAASDKSPGGWPMSKTTPRNYRAGYSLRHRWL